MNSVWEISNKIVLIIVGSASVKTISSHILSLFLTMSRVAREARSGRIAAIFIFSVASCLNSLFALNKAFLV